MRRAIIFLLLLSALWSLTACGGTPAGTEAPEPADESAAPRTPEPAPSTVPATPVPSPETCPASTATPSAAPAPSVAPTPAPPYSVQTGDTVLTVTGTATDQNYYFTLADLMAMSDGYVEADYFSRGKEPQELTNSFKGIRVQYLLEIIGLGGAGRVQFSAADGYAASFGMSAVTAAYLDETVPGKTLPMILAWEEDGAACGLRLVMGQQIEGEYNRTNWVRDVVQLEVSMG